MSTVDPFGARAPLPGVEATDLFRLERLAETGVGDPSRLPVTVRILLENLLRHADQPWVHQEDVETLARWDGRSPDQDRERAFMPSRVLLQDFTGVPAVVDLAAMRSAMARSGGDPARIDPLVPVDLVVDHSVQVDEFGDADSYAANIRREYERNSERYELLRWAQQAFRGFRVVPPGMGIVHQINLEYLAAVVQRRPMGDRAVALPDTLVGTDSHTTMVNGLGVLGWGVGGIEAEAVMLGQPLFLLTPVVVGVQFHNALVPGVTATDLVLTLTEMLRRHGVVGKFVEFCGVGLSSMSVPDRATLSNMAPEYGATAAIFPVDDRTLEYLRESNRPPELVDLVDRYTRTQGMFRTDDAAIPVFNEVLELDLASVVPSVAGPRRPQDRVALSGVRKSFDDLYAKPPAAGADLGRWSSEGGTPPSNGTVVEGPARAPLSDGDVVIAAITSCTNTSNPSVMLSAGLLARNAVARGLQVPAHVKTSLAPGSRVVTDYLERAGVIDPLATLGFNLVGYGCTTCIGNSGPLPDAVSNAITENDLAVAAVLSGNRNFEGRIHAQVRAAYLASPPLVVAYALAGSIRTDLDAEPLGVATDGDAVYLRDIWPTDADVSEALRSVGPDLFAREYGRISEGDQNWRGLRAPSGAMFEWNPASTYVQEPPFFTGDAVVAGDIAGARALAVLGNSITTDHISPAGSISRTSPAASYLRDHDVDTVDFNTYGSRRGNHEVMMRGTFANIRLRNLLAGGREGGITPHLPDGEMMSIYDAAMRYRDEGTPLVVLAGTEYGSGSSRDWAAKGTLLLGVRAVIAQSYERIHRSNLVGMGVLPLQFLPGEGVAELGLTGRETFAISGVGTVTPGARCDVAARADDGSERRFTAVARLDSDTDVEYFRCGGILPLVLRQLTSR